MKKLRFLAADFEKCKKEKILNSLNLPNMVRRILSQIACRGTCYSRNYV